MRFPLQTCPFIQIGITSENIEMVVEQLASVVSVATDKRDQISGNAAIISSTLSSAATVVTSGNFSIDIPVRLNMACVCVVLLVYILLYPTCMVLSSMYPTGTCMQICTYFGTKFLN